MTRVNSELGVTFRSLVVSGNTVSFYASKDGSGTALFTFNFLEELALQQLGTEIVEIFAFSAATYLGATNPTVKYSFVDMAKVIKAIPAGDNFINVKLYYGEHSLTPTLDAIQTNFTLWDDNDQLILKTKNPFCADMRKREL